jgi:hypothetical protein
MEFTGHSDAGSATSVHRPLVMKRQTIIVQQWK